MNSIEHKIRELEKEISHIEKHMFGGYLLSNTQYSNDEKLRYLREELSYFMGEYGKRKMNEADLSPDEILDNMDFNIIERYVRRKKLEKLK